MAMMISWVELVNPSHLYLENDQLRRLTPTICAFHLGFSLGFAHRESGNPAEATRYFQSAGRMAEEQLQEALRGSAT